MALTQVDPEALADACGPDPTFVCRWVLERTESRSWAEFADVVFGRPLRILLILLVAFVVVRLLQRLISRFEKSMSGENPPTRRLKRRLRAAPGASRLPQSVLATGQYSIRSAARAATLAYVMRSVVSFAVWMIAFITILGELGINLGPLVAGAGIAGVALGFGAQSLVKDFLAGMFILIEDQYGVGDIVDVGEASGTVEAVSLRTTRLRDVQGTVWHVPNGQILRVGNMSQQWARALLDVSIGYGADVEQAESIIKSVADELWGEVEWRGRILEEPEVWGIEQVSADEVLVRLVIKTRPAAQWGVMRELRRRIKAALDEAGIERPLSQRTLWLGHDDGVARGPAADDDAAPAKKAAKRPSKSSAKAGAAKTGATKASAAKGSSKDQSPEEPPAEGAADQA